MQQAEFRPVVVKRLTRSIFEGFILLFDEYVLLT